MRPLFALPLLLLLAGPAAAAQLYPFEVARTIDPTKAACFMPRKSIVVGEPSVSAGKKWFELCAVPGTLITTTTGARAQFLVSAGFKTPMHAAYFREVDCKKMEERAQDLWEFRLDKPLPQQRNAAAFRFFEKDRIWVNTYAGRWSSWEPITTQTDDHKWLCAQWRKVQGL